MAIKTLELNKIEKATYYHRYYCPSWTDSNKVYHKPYESITKELKDYIIACGANYYKLSNKEGPDSEVTSKWDSALWIDLRTIPITSNTKIISCQIKAAINGIYDNSKSSTSSGLIKYRYLGSTADNLESITYNNYDDLVKNQNTYLDTHTQNVTGSISNGLIIDVPENILKAAKNYGYLLVNFPNSSAPQTTIEYRSFSITLTYDDGTPTVDPQYPSNVNVKNNSSKVVFSWTYSCGNESAIQTKYKFELRTNSETIESVTNTSGDHFYECTKDLSAYTGLAYWRVTVYNAITSTTSAWIPFTFIGKTDAPTITNITMDARPTITWTVVNQSAYEIKIIRNDLGTVVYQTGLINSSDLQTTLSKMFAENKYTVSMRVLNSYGYYSDWTSYYWDLVYTTKPDTPSKPVVNVINGKMVEIITFDSLTSGDDKYWVVRTDEEGNETVIAVHLENDTIDSKCALNTIYYYKIRHYNENASGFADSETVIAYVEASGAIVNTIGNNPQAFELWKNDDEGIFEINKSDSTEKTFHWVLGRKYPVMETADWITQSRTLKAHISDDDFKKLLEIVRNNESVYYRSSGESFLSNMEMSYSGAYTGGGVIASFTFTRINEDEVDLES